MIPHSSLTHSKCARVDKYRLRDKNKQQCKLLSDLCDSNVLIEYVLNKPNKVTEFPYAHGNSRDNQQDRNRKELITEDSFTEHWNMEFDNLIEPKK